MMREYRRYRLLFSFFFSFVPSMFFMGFCFFEVCGGVRGTRFTSLGGRCVLICAFSVLADSFLIGFRFRFVLLKVYRFGGTLSCFLGRYVYTPFRFAMNHDGWDGT